MTQPKKDKTSATPVPVEPTPIGDAVAEEVSRTDESPDPADVTVFPEDDNPETLAGDFVDDEESK